MSIEQQKRTLEALALAIKVDEQPFSWFRINPPMLTALNVMYSYIKPYMGTNKFNLPTFKVIEVNTTCLSFKTVEK